jgi:hypothetical protein
VKGKKLVTTKEETALLLNPPSPRPNPDPMTGGIEQLKVKLANAPNEVEDKNATELCRCWTLRVIGLYCPFYFEENRKWEQN